MKDLKEKLKTWWGKALAFLKKVSKKVWIVLALVLVLAAAAITIFLNTRPYSVLVTGATTDELSTIMTWLDNQGFREYRVEGDTIQVPTDRANNLKARMLMEVYPSRTSSGFQAYFENVSALSTQSERNTSWQVALMEQLASVVRCFDGVQDATVNLNAGEDMTYVLDSSRMVSASASVFVTMQSNRTLTNQQATAIRTYIANAVQGLDIDSVTITDSYGNTYNSAGDYAYMDASALKLQLEEETANKVRTQVLQVLRPIYGEDNVKVAVNAIVDVSYWESDKDNVYLPDWAADGSTGGAGIIGRRTYSYTFNASDDVIAGGLVGTPSNSELPMYVEEEPTPDDADGKIHGSGELDYKNSTEKIHQVNVAGRVEDCTVAVSINYNTAGPVDIEAIRNHVARAAGINAVVTEEMTAEEYLAGKISVLSEPFFEDTTPAPSTGGFLGTDIPLWVVIAAAAGLLLFLILLIVILLLRSRRKKKRMQEELAAQEEQAKLLAEMGIISEEGEPVGADVMELQTERNMELRQDIRKFVEECPEIAAQLVKAWLRGGDDDG